MKKVLKIFCIIGVILLLTGGIFFGVGVIAVKGDVQALSHLKIKEYSYTETSANAITSVYVDYDSSADICVQFSDTAGSVYVEYVGLQTKNGKDASDLSVSDLNGQLKIVERTKTIGKFSFFSLDAQVNITLPSSKAYALDVKTDTGDVILKGNGNLTRLNVVCDTGDILSKSATLVCTGKMEVQTDTGDIELGQFSATTAKIKVDTGDIDLKNATATEKIWLSSDTGDVEITGVITAQEIVVETDTGDFETEKGGMLDASVIRLEADTGDIKVKIAGSKEDYTIFVDKDTGKSNVHSTPGGERRLTVEVDTGDIYVTFER